jgi:signal transduction histidine kinase
LNPSTGLFEEKYWAARNVPILHPQDPDKILFIYQKVQDVTHLKDSGILDCLEEVPEALLDRLDFQRETSEIRMANEVLFNTNRRLQEALRKAEIAHKAKEEFSANVAHEIRFAFHSYLSHFRAKTKSLSELP